MLASQRKVRSSFLLLLLLLLHLYRLSVDEKFSVWNSRFINIIGFYLKKLPYYL